MNRARLIAIKGTSAGMTNSGYSDRFLPLAPEVSGISVLMIEAGRVATNEVQG